MSYHMSQHGYRFHVTVLMGDGAPSSIISESVVLNAAGVNAVQGTPQALVSRVQKRNPNKTLTTS